MEITRSNYENFIIDYIDGTLSAAGYKSMKLFLEKNPDIAEELQELQNCVLSDEPENKLDKSVLYKMHSEVHEINDNNFEEFCIAYYEGNLDLKTREKLRKFVEEDPKRERTFKLYASLKLLPDMEVRFPSRKSLKKFNISFRKRLYYYSASAAAIILLAFLYRSYQGFQIDKGFNEHGNITVISNIPIVETESSSQIVPFEKVVDNQKVSNNIIAAIDTQNAKKPRYIRLTSVVPKRALIENKIAINQDPIVSNTIKEEINNNELISANPEISENKNPGTMNKKILIKALRMGIQGLGNLTENNLELIAQSDKDGNIIELGISTGQFEISRKKNITTQQRN